MKRVAIGLCLWVAACLTAQAQIVTDLQRSPTITVAASDTPAKYKARADYVCTGTGDQAKINSAIAALAGAGANDVPTQDQTTYKNQGGRVLLLAGSYKTSAPITNTSKHAVSLQGEGPATVIFGTATDQSDVISFVGTSQTRGLSRCEVRDLAIVGNYTSAGVRNGNGITFTDIEYPHISNVHVLSCGGDGIAITNTDDTKGPENRVLSDCQVLFCRGHGISLTKTHDFLLANTHLEENYGDQLYAVNNVGLYVSNLNCEDPQTGAYSINIASGQMPILSNVVTEAGKIKLAPSIDSWGCLNASNVAEIEMAATSSYRLVITGSSCTRLSGTGTAGHVRAAASTVPLSSIPLVSAHFDGCRLNLIKNADTSDSTITFTDAFTITGGRLETESIDQKLQMAASNARFAMSGTAAYYYGFTIDGNSQATTRVSITGCNLRTMGLAVTGVPIVHCSGNISSGSCAWSFTGIATALNIIGNTFWNSHTLTIDGTTGAVAQIRANDGTGLTLTDSSGKAVVVGNAGIASVAAKTGDFTLTKSHNGATFSTGGSATQVTFTLPASLVGLEFTFVKTGAGTLTLQAPTGATVGGSASGKKYENTTAGETSAWVRVLCVATNTWIVIGSSGTWAVNDT